MRILSALLLVAALSLAGCAGGSDGSGSGPDGQDPTSSTSGTRTSTTTQRTTTQGPTSQPTGGGGAGGANHAPTGSISTSATTGGAPLNVTFTMEGVDQNGDDLAWSLDANGDGTPDMEMQAPAIFPVTFSYIYQTAGVFEATYTVSDGAADASYKATINVTASGAASGQHFEGSWPGGGTPVECVYGFFAQTAGLTYVEMAVAPATQGKDFTAVFTAVGSPACAGISWFSEEEYLEESGGPGVTATTITGTVPGDAARAMFYFLPGANVSVVYDAE